jgi:hypothetical protein
MSPNYNHQIVPECKPDRRLTLVFIIAQLKRREISVSSKATEQGFIKNQSRNQVVDVFTNH